MTIFRILFASFLFMLLSCCGKNDDFLLFSIFDDVELGERITMEINKDETITILSRSEYEAAYSYVDDIMNNILSTGYFVSRDTFDWQVYIIDQEALNALSVPGGSIYIATELIYFLDNEDDFVGWLGHEMIHITHRHRSKQLQKMYGISTLLEVSRGQDQATLNKISELLIGKDEDILPYVRSSETFTDSLFVMSLENTQYSCSGYANFFAKLLKNQSLRQPKFLEIHPSLDDRVGAINDLATKIACNKSIDRESVNRFRNFRSLLR